MISRYCILVIFFTAFYINESKAQKLIFSYDASGNQVQRMWICINCSTTNLLNTAKNMTNELRSEITGDGLTTERGLKAYPNPLKENLNLEWTVPEKVSLQSIDVYNVGGNVVYRKKYALNERTAQISFNQLPPGTYVLVAKYSDSKSESIKVIKI